MNESLQVARKLASTGNGWERVMIFCPGCRCGHVFTVKNPTPGGCQWDWNGSFDKPTFTPSMLCNKSEPARRCHSFVTDGQIRFLADCHHDLKGRTLPLEPF